MKFFKPEDFPRYSAKFENEIIPLLQEAAAFFANEKLEKEGIVLYSREFSEGKPWSYNKFQAKRTAILINIQPIEPCKHPVDKVKKRNMKATPYDFYHEYECECGTRVVPNTFKED